VQNFSLNLWERQAFSFLTESKLGLWPSARHVGVLARGEPVLRKHKGEEGAGGGAKPEPDSSPGSSYT
jgi:hypothetical protein